MQFVLLEASVVQCCSYVCQRVLTLATYQTSSITAIAMNAAVNTSLAKFSYISGCLTLIPRVWAPQVYLIIQPRS